MCVEEMPWARIADEGWRTVMPFNATPGDEFQMKAVLSFLCAVGIGLAPVLVQAKTGRCVLQVNTKTFLDGPCEIKINDKQGSFSIGAGDSHRSKYFAYVSMEEDGAHGYWNETPDASHAHADLGILQRDGACWKNDTARVCAYK